jgi:hypothetical protein
MVLFLLTVRAPPPPLLLKLLSLLHPHHHHLHLPLQRPGFTSLLLKLTVSVKVESTRVG